MPGSPVTKDIRPVLRRARGACAASAALLLIAGCSISYDATEEQSLSEEIPNTVAVDVVHKVHKDGHLALQLEAARAESFDSKKKTVLTNAHFIEFDAKGETATEGTGGTVVFHTDTQDAEITGSVRLHSAVEKGDVSARALSWTHQTRTLTAEPGERVDLRKDDGTSISGIGFTGDFRRRQVTFTGGVRGTYVWEKKKTGE
jgi:LPS export ABC transporter protein LptC